MSALLAKLDEECKQHNWAYLYSDNHRVYSKGKNAAIRIRNMKTELQENGLLVEANEIYHKHYVDQG